MLDILLVVAFCWLFFKALGLVFRVTWGMAKLVASLLFLMAAPLLVLILVFTGGVMLLIPLIMVAVAFGILKALV